MDADLLIPSLTFVVMCTIFPLTIFFFVKKEITAKQKIAETAKLLGLESSRTDFQSFIEGNPVSSKIPAGILKLLTIFVDPVYTGKVRGYDIKIDFERRGPSRKKTMYTLLTLAFREEIHFDINIKREGTLGMLANLTGFKDISLNDSDFDSFLRIKVQVNLL